MKESPFAFLRAILILLVLAALAPAQLSEDFETFVAVGAGIPNAPQNGWYVPPIASTLDLNAYTYVGNVLGFPQNPVGGSNFTGGTNTGGAFNVRTEHLFGNPPYTGIWSAQFDICVDFLGTTYPAVQNIGSFSLQPSTTAKTFIALATWTTPIPTAGQPTGWTLDWIFFDSGTGATQVQASAGNAALGYPVNGLPTCFTNLHLRNWYRVKVWWDWSTNALVRIALKDLSAGWQAFINFPIAGVPPWCLRGGLGNVAAVPDPNAVRFFIGGTTAGNTAGYDNLVVGPDSVPFVGNEYQVNQPGIATGDLNGVQGTAWCPAVLTTSYSGGTIIAATLNGSASYDIALSVGPALPAS